MKQELKPFLVFLEKYWNRKYKSFAVPINKTLQNRIELLLRKYLDPFFQNGCLNQNLSQSDDIIVLSNSFSIFVKVVNIVFGLDQPIFNFNLLFFSNYDIAWTYSPVNYSLLVQKSQALQHWNEGIKQLLLFVLDNFICSFSVLYLILKIR